MTTGKFTRELKISLDESLYRQVKAAKINASQICRHFLAKAVAFVKQPRKETDPLSSLDEEFLQLLIGTKLNIE